MSNPDGVPQNSDEREEEGSPLEHKPLDSRSGGKEQGDSNRIVPTTGIDPAPMVPITTDKTVLSIIENPSVLEALVQEAPAEVMRSLKPVMTGSLNTLCKKKQIDIKSAWHVKPPLG